MGVSHITKVYSCLALANGYQPSCFLDRSFAYHCTLSHNTTRNSFSLFFSLGQISPITGDKAELLHCGRRPFLITFGTVLSIRFSSQHSGSSIQARNDIDHVGCEIKM